MNLIEREFFSAFRNANGIKLVYKTSNIAFRKTDKNVETG